MLEKVCSCGAVIRGRSAPTLSLNFSYHLEGKRHRAALSQSSNETLTRASGEPPILPRQATSDSLKAENSILRSEGIALSAQIEEMKKQLAAILVQIEGAEEDLAQRRKALDLIKVAVLQGVKFDLIDLSEKLRHHQPSQPAVEDEPPNG